MLATQVDEAFAAARAQGANFMILPGPTTPDALYLPVSVLGTVVESTAEFSIDDRVVDAVEHRGATPLAGSRHFLHWTMDRVVTLAGESVRARTIVYLAPVPNTQRRKALQLTATFPYPTDAAQDEEPVIAMWQTLLDSSFASFTWVTDA